MQWMPMPVFSYHSRCPLSLALISSLSSVVQPYGHVATELVFEQVGQGFVGEDVTVAAFEGVQFSVFACVYGQRLAEAV